MAAASRDALGSKMLLLKRGVPGSIPARGSEEATQPLSQAAWPRSPCSHTQQWRGISQALAQAPLPRLPVPNPRDTPGGADCALSSAGPHPGSSSPAEGRAASPPALRTGISLCSYPSWQMVAAIIRVSPGIRNSVNWMRVAASGRRGRCQPGR